MQLPTLLLYMIINVTLVIVVARIFSLVCYNFHVFIFPAFHLFFLSLEASDCSFYFNPFDCSFFRRMFSGYCACTQVSSTDMGLKNITLFCRWLCFSPIYSRSTSRIFGETPNIMIIFLKSMVYSHALCS